MAFRYDEGTNTCASTADAWCRPPYVACRHPYWACRNMRARDHTCGMCMGCLDTPCHTPCLSYRHSMPVISTLHAWHIDILCLHQHSMPGTSKLHAWHIDAPCLSCRHSMPGIHALLIWCAIPHDVCNSSVGSIWLMLTMVHVGNGAY